MGTEKPSLSVNRPSLNRRSLIILLSSAILILASFAIQKLHGAPQSGTNKETTNTHWATSSTGLERDAGLVIGGDPNLGGELENGHVEDDNDNDGDNDSEDDGADGHDEAGGAKSKSRFSWSKHKDDHSIYANRALMITSDSNGSNGGSSSSSDTASGSLDAPRLDNQPADKYQASRRSVPSKYDQDDDYEPLNTIDYAEKEWQLMFRALDSSQDTMSGSILFEIEKHTRLLAEIISRLKPACKRDIHHIRDSIKRHKLWALKVVDSFGKIPSGVTYGKFSSPGDYEECLSIKVDERVVSYSSPATTGFSRAPSSSHQAREAPATSEHYKFHGKYCLFDFRLPLPERPRDRLLSVHEPVLDFSKTQLLRQFPELANYSGYASVFYEVGYMHAFCLPSSCEVDDVLRSARETFEGLHIIVNNTVDCEEKFGEAKTMRASQWASLLFLVVLFSNAALASFARSLYARLDQEASKKVAKAGPSASQSASVSMGQSMRRQLARYSRPARLYADCFSIQSNFERLTKPDPRGLTFVHYTRIVAMALTVITHTAGMGTLQAITKPADASNSEYIFRDFIPQMLANAFTSIQIFFFMAGLMLVISTYPSLKRDQGRLSFIEHAVKRAVRLMPGLAATICLNFLWPLVVDGPMLTYFDRVIVVPCETNWWRTLAFLSNFDHVEKMCLRHSYFSASDYQLHIMAFPLLVLLYKQPLLSLTISTLLVVAGFAAQVIMVLTKILLPFMMIDYIDKEAFFNVVHYIHHPVWNHMSAFFYGFIIGYLVVTQTRIRMSTRVRKYISLFLMPAGLASIFAPYFWNHYKRPIYRWQMVLYVIIDRFVLLTTCAWLAYSAMVLGRRQRTRTPAQKPAASNLPDQVHLSDAEKSTVVASIGRPAVQFPLPTLKIDEPESPQLANGSQGKPPIKLVDALSAVARPRSSPNLRSLEAIDECSSLDRTTIRPSNSSVEVAAASPPDGETAPEDNVTQLANTQAAPKRRGPISNVNTLCLVFSRLTFQLYLFNMVVLWVDVNHSKYNWYFSYYFIITKAFAVYICSSILATIFFVTLESPCLALYIIWVKGRAKRYAESLDRKDCGSDGASNGEKVAATSRQPQHGASTNQRTRCSQTREPDAMRNHSPLRHLARPRSAMSDYDGLCLRTFAGSESGGHQKQQSFSYIDLTEPVGTRTRFQA